MKIDEDDEYIHDNYTECNDDGGDSDECIIIFCNVHSHTLNLIVEAECRVLFHCFDV